MVGMPVFIDQGDVLTRMVEKGIAVGVDKTASADTIHDAIVKVRRSVKVTYSSQIIQTGFYFFSW